MDFSSEKISEIEQQLANLRNMRKIFDQLYEFFAPKTGAGFKIGVGDEIQPISMTTVKDKESEIISRAFGNSK